MSRTCSSIAIVAACLLVVASVHGSGRTLPSSAVIEIRAHKSSGLVSGTGFLIATDGLAVTNLHLVRRATAVGIKLASGEIYDRVEIAGFDAKRDLVLLRFPAVGLPALQLGNSTRLRGGESVLVLSHADGPSPEGLRGKVLDVRVLPEGIKVVRTDLAAASGNSGGPLLDRRGHVVGVVAFRSAAEEGVSFAIPVEAVAGLREMQERLSLAELQESLTEAVDLFGTQGVSGKWRSLSSLTTHSLIQLDDRIYGTLEDAAAKPGSNVSYDLKVGSGGLFEGQELAHWSCSYWNPWKQSYSWRKCSTSARIVFSSVDENRIEGTLRSRTPPPTGTKAWTRFCKSCGEAVEPSEKPFVWVRVE